jgi:acetyl/propionyl-CoA carboxylase alpha subunit/acetyl-CoA carboxylase carboxyltransferase component
MPVPQQLLIANRGEIALRLAHAAADLGIRSTAVWADEDAAAPHVRAATRAHALGAAGPAAYLDGPRLIALALDSGCDAVHPGYGFLSESAAFAQACADAGLLFIGPTPAQLALLGDKAQALALARAQAVPVLPGSAGVVDVAAALQFMADQGGAPVMLKAVAGGGGRGLRVVQQAADLPAAFERCTREALAATGHAQLYAERWLPQARHIEVQLLGDGQRLLSLGERECTLQRQHQKLVEVAPSPSLQDPLRQRIVQAALAMAHALRLHNLCTFEFLVASTLPEGFVFIEANPRLQVEHTVTEMVTGLDLVRLQIQLAAGAKLADLDLRPTVRGVAVQWRINAEATDAQGQILSAAGTLSRFDMPLGPGLRVDTAAAVGQTSQPQFDSLLAKLVVQGADWPEALRRSQRALAACVVQGVDSNLALLQALGARAELQHFDVHTGFVQQHLQALNGSLAAAADHHRLIAPMAGRLVTQEHRAGQMVAAGTPLAVLEAMKMQHELAAPTTCCVQSWLVQPGQLVSAGAVLATLLPQANADSVDSADAGAAPGPRADLQAVQARWALTLDAARPQAIAKRHAQGQRSARENVAATCDPGSFIEYGAFAVAAQRSRRSAEDLVANTPADGLVCGIGTVQGLRVALLAYDATVLAGTQGFRNHQKTDRLLGLAQQQRLPVVLWAEGGGGRPGDVDMPIVAGLHVPTFASMARLSGQVPLIGIAAGRCFAGNAALLGCCDIVVATRSANIGMGGPAMIEGGGLGVFKPEQIGPAAVQAGNGVIDVLVDDEPAAAVVARQLLALLHGPQLGTWQEPDAGALRTLVPVNRLRVYDMRQALQGLFDSGTVVELRAAYGGAVITALARLQGRAVAVLASNPAQGGAAVDAAAADKAAGFMQLCQRHRLPLLSLIDTPGFMVGPAAEEQALVRHAGRLFIAAAALTVPKVAVVLRRAYGLGAMALAGGGFHEAALMAAWPSAEFGAMGLEGAVRLGWRKELQAAAPGAEREALFNRLLAQQVESGGAIPMATTLEIDAVIDPADTRAWLVRALPPTGLTSGPGNA